MGHGIDPTRRTSLQISFLIAEHTKFSPDLLLSMIAQTYNESDVFNTNELGDIVSRYATVAIAGGTMVHDWRSVFTKYSKLPGQKFTSLSFCKACRYQEILSWNLEIPATMKYSRIHPFMWYVVGVSKGTVFLMKTVEAMPV